MIYMDFKSHNFPVFFFFSFFLCTCLHHIIPTLVMKPTFLTSGLLSRAPLYGLIVNSPVSRTG